MDALPTRAETVRVITSLTTAKAGAVRMQELVRLHGSNRLIHILRDLNGDLSRL